MNSEVVHQVTRVSEINHLKALILHTASYIHSTYIFEGMTATAEHPLWRLLSEYQFCVSKHKNSSRKVVYHLCSHLASTNSSLYYYLALYNSAQLIGPTLGSLLLIGHCMLDQPVDTWFKICFLLMQDLIFRLRIYSCLRRPTDNIFAHGHLPLPHYS